MSRRMIRNALLILGLVAILPPPVQAQGIGSRLRDRVRERVDRATDETMDRLLNRLENAVRCKIGDEACVERAEQAGKDVVLTDANGRMLPADQQPEGSPAADARAHRGAAGQAAAAPAARPGEGAWANFDFVPGERVIFAEDFSADRVGNFPRRLEMISGNSQVVEWEGRRLLSVASGAESDARIAIPLPEVLPERFTVEMDITLPWWGLAIYPASDVIEGGEGGQRSTGWVRLSGTDVGIIRANSTQGSTQHPDRALGETLYEDGRTISRLMRVRLEVDGDYAKLYLDQTRVANIPNAALARANKLIFEFDAITADEHGKLWPVLIGNISINAGGREMYDALMADGRVVTQGIYFDVNSDRIRPESTATLKQIGDMLRSHADLSLNIEGHTDNTGAAAANQTLSQKRAAAIVAYLTTTFSIDAARLTPVGLGASKPAASNDTPEGRQANRRVELVKR